MGRVGKGAAPGRLFRHVPPPFAASVRTMASGPEVKGPVTWWGLGPGGAMVLIVSILMLADAWDYLIVRVIGVLFFLLSIACFIGFAIWLIIRVIRRPVARSRPAASSAEESP